VKRRELIRHLERFGCVLADEGSKHSNMSISRIHAALRRSQGIRKLPISSHARFAVSSVSPIQNSPVRYRDKRLINQVGCNRGL
jgi:hypothetical protein